MKKIHLISQILFFSTIVFIEYLATTSRTFEVVAKSWDKANHFFAFFVLYLLFSFSYPKLNIFYKSIALLLFGIQIEIVQYFLPFRYFSLFDVIADCIGVGIGIFFYPHVRKIAKI